MNSQGELFRFNHYPNVPGFTRPGTSQQAAVEIAPEASVLQRECFRLLAEKPSTADEVAEKLARSILAIRPRLSELVAKGLIEETNVRHINASGKWAIVWRVCASHAHDAL